MFGKIILENRTPHDINYVTSDGETIIFPKCTNPCRIIEDNIPFVDYRGLKIDVRRLKHIDGMPEEKEGYFYIVSTMVKDRCPDRQDLIVPGEFIRAANGTVIACTKFLL